MVYTVPKQTILSSTTVDTSGVRLAYVHVTQYALQTDDLPWDKQTYY